MTKKRNCTPYLRFKKVAQVPVYLQMLLGKTKTEFFSTLADRFNQNLMLHLTFNLR